DNDIFGTEETIGFDTTANTAVAEIDKIRDTAVSLERVFMIEVMGRKSGFLALEIGLTVGAEIILVPEVKYQTEKLFETVRENMAKGKKSGHVFSYGLEKFLVLIFHFWNENYLGANGEADLQREKTTFSPHHLNHENSLKGNRRVSDLVDFGDCRVCSRVKTYGFLCSKDIVVD